MENEVSIRKKKEDQKGTNDLSKRCGEGGGGTIPAKRPRRKVIKSQSNKKEADQTQPREQPGMKTVWYRRKMQTQGSIGRKN